MKRLWIAILTGVLLLGTLTVVGCGSSSSQPPSDGGANTQPQGNTVVMKNTSFQPQEITISTGGELTWINQDSVNHTIVGDNTGPGGDFQSGVLQPGEEFSFVFDQPGTFTYHCSIHPNMKGTVIVTGQPTPAS
jgi:plastocyanin